MKIALLTGATRGLGLAIAHALDEIEGLRLVLAVRDLAAGRAVAKSLRGGAQVVKLDLSSMNEVIRFAAGWSEPLWALINNAALQLPGPVSFTEDGFERTVAVNYLAPIWLSLGLLSRLHGGRVLGIGSAAHDPQNRGAAIFGFRGGRFTSVAALARGESDGDSDRQRGFDRYATSKLMIMAAAAELARRVPETSFITLDPGLMPGTGLVRDASWLERLGWSSLLSWIAPILPQTSSTERSARAARWLLTLDSVENGQVYDYRQRPCPWVWPKVRDAELGRAIIDQTIELLQPRWSIDTLPPG